MTFRKGALVAFGLGLAALIPGVFVAAEINAYEDPAVLAARSKRAIARADFLQEATSGIERRPAAIETLAADARAASSALAAPGALAAIAKTIAPGSESTVNLDGGVPRLALRGSGGAAALSRAVRRAGEVAPILGVSAATVGGDRWSLELVALAPVDAAVLQVRAPNAAALLAGKPLPTPFVNEHSFGNDVIPSIRAENYVEDDESRAKTLDDVRRYGVELEILARGAGAMGRARRSREVVELLTAGPRPVISAGKIGFDATCESATLALWPATGRSPDFVAGILGEAGALSSIERGAGVSGASLTVALLLR